MTNKMTPIQGYDSFEKQSAGWLNIFKILSLIAIAGWTIYQWNRTIFPKESYDALIKAAKDRTDLSVVFEAPHIDYIRLSDKVSKLPDGTEAELIAISSECVFENKKALPILLDIKKAQLYFGELDEGQKEIPKSKFDIPNWNLVPSEVELSTIFANTLGKEPILLEQNGKIKLPIYFTIRTYWKPEEKYRYLQLNIDYEITSIHPETNEKIEKSKKAKNFSYRGILHRKLPEKIAAVDTNTNRAPGTSPGSSEETAPFDGRTLDGEENKFRVHGWHGVPHFDEGHMLFLK